jgi:predicted transposase YdaD
MNSVERLREEGRQQGREEGRTEGQRDMLIEQLREKFVGVEDADVARVEQADEAALERYLRRIVTADSIDAVFGD